MSEDAAAEPPDPSPVWRTIAGYQVYWAAVAAVTLGLFDALAASPADSAELGRRMSCDPSRVAVVADVLVAAGLLERREGPPPELYDLHQSARTFLVSGADRSMTDLLLRSPGPWENWPALADTVRGASPPVLADGPFYASLVEATFPTQYAAAKVFASDLASAQRVLDLGAGAAPWSIALLEAFPAATALAVDLPDVIPATDAELREHAVRDRCDVLAGDYWQVGLDRGSYDVVVLGHVLRAEGRRSGDLVSRAALALAPGGIMVVADYFLDDDRRGPFNSLLLGLTMMSATPDGRTFTRSEHESWLVAAGLVEVEKRQLIPGQEVLVARMPDPAGAIR